jgi:glycosyltransferase involved in cell wall biosynthesis
MPVRFLGPRPPVVLSDSAGTFWYWSRGRGMPEDRVRRLLRREAAVARRVGFLHPTVNPAGERMIFFVESGIRLAEQLGIRVGNAVICPPGVPSATARAGGDGRTLLFVGRAFEYKGGPDALAILARVRRFIPEARLLVAGPERREQRDEPGVEWLGPVGRDSLYKSVYPSADLFVYPTRFDAAPLVVQEALAHGLPVVAPRHLSMPDLIEDERSGYLFEPGNVAQAAEAVLQILRDRNLREAMSNAAQTDFELRFSRRRRNEILGEVYRSVVR